MRQDESEREIILIADDDLASLKLLLESLRQAGFAITTLEDGESVLAQALELQPALILVNATMPSLDAAEIIARLKTSEDELDNPVIFLVTAVEALDVVRALAVGGVDYLIKPIQVEPALSRLNTHLTLRRLRRENSQLQAIIAQHQQQETGLQSLNAELEQQLEILATLNLIAQTVTIVSDLKIALDIVASAIAQLVKARGAIIGFFNSTCSEFRIMAHFEYDKLPPNLVDQVVPVADNPLILDLISRGQSLVVPQVETNPLLFPIPEDMRRQGIHTLLHVPLLARGQVAGIISVVADQPDREFTRAEISLVETAAAQIAGVVDIARLFDELQQSEARYRAMVEEQTDLICRFLDNGVLTFVNDAYCRYFGKSRDELIGQRYTPLIHADDQAAMAAYWAKVRANLAFEPVEHRVIAASNGEETRWVQWHTRAILNEQGQAIEFQGVGRDITERKLFEIELARFRAMMDQVGEAIFVIDPASSRFIDCNETACRFLGYTRQELLRLRVLDIELSQAQATPEQWQAHVEDIKRHAPFYIRQGQHRRKDNSIYPVEVIISYRTFEDRDYILAVARDITERLRFEEQLRQSQKMEAVGQLAGGVAHNFNNMLTAIIGYSELASESLGPDHPAWRDLRSVINSAQRVATLTQQLLAFSRPQQINPQLLDLNQVIFNMTPIIRQAMGETIEVVTALAPNLGQIKADSGQMEQMLLNLCLNARDAMPQGGLLTIETSQVTLTPTEALRLGEFSAGEYVLLRLTDTGVGMSPEVQTRIFEPFFTTKEMDQGTGLGLSICFGIVRQSGGHILVESSPGRGATFCIYLPLIKAGSPRPQARPTAAQPEIEPGPKTVLLVEDEAIVRDLASRVLQQHGYRVFQANNGREALELLDNQPEVIPDLLISDVVMPELGGPGLVRRLRQRWPELKVLFISGYTPGKENIEAGAPFLAKPFNSQKLMQRVRQLLEETSRPPG
jgi:PAS domain S-box-containing protein